MRDPPDDAFSELRTARAQKRRPKRPFPGIKTSKQFVEDFVPPDYVVDGMLQRRFIYSFTAHPSNGKTAIAMLFAAAIGTGRGIGEREVQKGNVLYFAGENPDDLRARWVTMAVEMKFDLESIPVRFIPGTFSIADLMETIAAEVKAFGGVILVVVDTSAAFFEGEEENSNTELGGHARLLRRLTELEGGPCVLVCCHPPKNSGNDHLEPRGGGAFIAEMDGNLTAVRDDTLVTLHHTKFRGPEFDPTPFELVETTCERLKDRRGRPLRSVIIRAIDASEETSREQRARRDEETLLRAIRDNPRASFQRLCTATGWPNKSKAHRVMMRLTADKLVVKKRGRYRLTDAGKSEVDDAETPG